MIWPLPINLELHCHRFHNKPVLNQQATPKQQGVPDDKTRQLHQRQHEQHRQQNRHQQHYQQYNQRYQHQINDNGNSNDDDDDTARRIPLVIWLLSRSLVTHLPLQQRNQQTIQKQQTATNISIDDNIVIKNTDNSTTNEINTRSTTMATAMTTMMTRHDGFW